MTIATGDVRLLTRAASKVGWLPLLGGTYLKSAYPALGTLFGTTYNSADIWVDGKAIANPLCNKPGYIFGVHIVGTNAGLQTSPNGITWTTIALTMTGAPSGFAYSSSLNLAVGTASTQFITAPNAATWTVRTPILASGSPALDILAIRDVAWDGTQFIAVGQANVSPTTLIMTSPDGLNWYRRTGPLATRPLYSIAQGAGLLVVTGTSGAIFTSTDGINWITATSNTTSNLFSVIWTGTQFVAVGAAGRIVTSSDGVTWLPSLIGDSNVLNCASVAYGNGTYVVMSSGTSADARSRLKVSYDLVTWEDRYPLLGTIGPMVQGYGVSFNNQQFIACYTSGFSTSGGIAYASMPDINPATQFVLPAFSTGSLSLSAWIKT
ncbi:WD40/YVTN/BNR-like repeat-containing protein [Polymorphobacter arshaanensis]|nr:tail fiber protein [Polymorphobacter arshaanensis]